MSTIKANTLLHSDGSTTNPPSIPALDKRMAKAWVNFNGMGTVAIHSSYNISSITDISVGKYKAHFTTAMSDINYCTSVGASVLASSSQWAMIGAIDNYTEAKNASWVRVVMSDFNNTQRDTKDSSILIFA